MPDVTNHSVAKPLTVDELGRIDDTYRKFPEFSSYAGSQINSTLWDFSTSRLASARSGASAESLSKAVETALRAAAIETGAIEGLYEVNRGFTISVAIEAAAWQGDLLAKGEDVRELFEAQLAAYELAMDAATKQMPISEAWIRRLHEVLTGPQATYKVLTQLGWQEQLLPKGRYKERPNHVRLADGSYHAYAPVLITPNEMHRFVEQLRSDDFVNAHPILQASYGHYVLTAIHPFEDGNGRVARALASVFLLRSDSIPLVVFSDQQVRYFDALHRADLRDPQPFVDFVFDRALDTVDLVVNQLAPSPEGAVAQLRNVLKAHGGLLYGQLDALASNLLNLAVTELTEQVKVLAPTLPQGVFLSGTNLSAGGPPFNVAPTHRFLFTQNQYPGIYISANLTSPINAQVNVQIYLLISLDANDRYPFVFTRDQNVDGLRVRLDDIYPADGVPFRLRLKTWIAALIGDVLQRLAIAAKQAQTRLP